MRAFFFFALSLGVLQIGCATTSSSASSSPAQSPTSTEGDAINDEPPLVSQCHTESGSCALSEPMLPGLGCFCETEQGRQVGNAGG